MLKRFLHAKRYAPRITSGAGFRSKNALPGLARRLHGVVAADEACILGDRRGLAEQIALHRVAAFLGKEIELFRGLHALGDDRHFETMAEVDNRAHDVSRLRRLAEIDDKGAVNLDLVERKGLQIAQRRVAAAEIV